MSYTVEKIDADKAQERLSDYKYALLYMMSELQLGRTTELQVPDWGECLEARFFDEEKELHIYEEDGDLLAVEVKGPLDDDCIVKKYRLKDGRVLCVCEHLKYDEDGQAQAALTRLTGIE